VLNEIISCKVTEGINDDYIAELEYPLEDSKGISSNIAETFILSIPTIDDREDQLFRIIDKQTTSDSVVVQCQSKLLADLKENAIRAATLTGLTRKQAITQILNNCLESHSYSVGNLDANANTNVILTVPESNPLTAIIGDENSVLTEYGGEYRVDNNKLDVINSRGSDNGVVIEYGKNLSSIKVETNITDLATVLIPKSGEYRLPEYCIESPRVNQYEKRYFKDVDLNLNIWDGKDEKKDDQITLEEAYTLMRSTCNKMFTVDKVDQFTFNYTVDFVQLSQTEEYKNYAILENVNVGDKVTVRHKKLNLDLQGRVNKITYSVNSEGHTTIDTVEIGFTRKNITDIIKTTVKQIKFAQDEIRLALNNSINGIETELKLANDKISAVVQKDGTGMGWTLSQVAFIVACLGASGANVSIDQYGLTVNNGKFFLKNDSDIVFKVNTSGKCNAIGGFYVDDNGKTCCAITSDGVTLKGLYTGYIKPHPEKDGIYVSNDLYCDDFHTNDFCGVGGGLEVGKNASIDGALFVDGNAELRSDLSVEGTLYVGGKTLREIIDARIDALT
jgi:phage minor structural protein